MNIIILLIKNAISVISEEIMKGFAVCQTRTSVLEPVLNYNLYLVLNLYL